MESTVDTLECPFCSGTIPAQVRKRKHCGEWVKKPEGSAPSTDERETCLTCGKKMFPRIITGPPLVHGRGSWTPVPKKSICPFCGATHREFQPSEAEKRGVVVFIGGVAVFIVVFLATAAFLVARILDFHS